MNFLNKIDNTSVVQKVIDLLTEAMISGDIKPGDQIPTENELSENLGVSRNTVREAVKILVAFGVLEIRRAEGTFVCSGLSESIINPLLYSIILNQGDSYEYIKEFRKMIETGIVKLSIEKRTEEDLNLLKVKYQNLIDLINTDHPDIEKVVSFDDDFHSVIAVSAHNPLLITIDRLVRKLTLEKRRETTEFLLANNREYFIEAHKKIYLAILNKQSENIDSLIPTHYFIDSNNPHLFF